MDHTLSVPVTAIDSIDNIANTLLILNPKMRVWMSDSGREEMVAGNMCTIVERLKSMEFLFLANAPISEETILGACNEEARFHPPDDMFGFSSSDRVCFSAFPIIAWVKFLKENLLGSFAFFDICSIAGPADSGGACN